MLEMFLLTEEEKKSFLKVIYSMMIFDRQISDEEEEILDIIKNEIFKIDKFQKIDLEEEKLIVDEINKISKRIPVIYLFDILVKLKDFVVKNKELYIEKVIKIMKNVNLYKEISRSKFFKETFDVQKTDKNQDKNLEDKKSKFFGWLS